MPAVVPPVGAIGCGLPAGRGSARRGNALEGVACGHDVRLRVVAAARGQGQSLHVQGRQWRPTGDGQNELRLLFGEGIILPLRI
ncbi:hypothetical protein GW17_00059205 [Ensete ventricosum]|nr:hypothetical protein GW17_00059205 [Ensete ventricosum]